MPKKKTKTKKKTVKKAKRTAKKKTLKKTSKKPAAKKVRKGSPAAPKAPKVKGTLIGKVTHYFPHVQAAVVKMTTGALKVGDRVYVKGHTTDFEQTVTSLQIDRKPIETAKKGDEFGMEVKDRVREDDAVYKL